MRKKATSPAWRIRRFGVKVHSGPWTLFAADRIDSTRGLTVALGRITGGAVVRNRIRRVARDIYRNRRDEFLGTNFLLVSRNSVEDEPRRRVRQALDGLLHRGQEAIVRRRSA